MTEDTMSSAERITQATYDANSAEYARSNSGENPYTAQLKAFTRLLPTGNLIDAGCGHGRYAASLIESGYGYTGVDFSENLLEIARANNPGVYFRHANMCDLPFPDDYFDGFWAIASLLHLPFERMEVALEELRRTTRGGGYGFVVMKEGSSYEFHAHGIKGERYYTYFKKPEMEAVLRKSGFQVIESLIHGKSSDGRPWMSLLVEVRK